MPQDLIGTSLGYSELHPFFPKANICQMWKIDWLTNKLVNSSEITLHSLRGLEKSHAVHIDMRPLLDTYKDAVNLSLRIGKKGTLIAPDNIVKVDTIIKNTNTYMKRLESSPYITELPFRTKAKLFEPMVDTRIAALNLKRAMKPCLVGVKPKQAPVTAGPTPITQAPPLISSNMMTIGRGFL